MAESIVNPHQVESQVKWCPRCETEKSITDFPKNKSRKEGVGGWCKKCDGKATKKYILNNKEKVVASKKRHYQENKEEIRQYNEANKEWRSQYNKERYYKNRDRELERGKIYYRKNKDQIAARLKPYNRQYLQDHKDERAAYSKKYRQSKQGRRAMGRAYHKYRALKLNAKSEAFAPDEIFERDGYICQLCGRKTRPDYKNYNHSLYPNLDHIVPLSRRGANTRKNTQCLCHQCNVRKYNNGKGDQLRMFG